MACCRGPRCLGQWPLGVNAARDFFQPASARFPGGGPAPLCTEDGTLNERGETAQGLQAARERDATLRAAVLRIGVRLDLDTVLREVVDGARALTGARYGGITTVDGDGQPRDFVTSGFSPDEHRAMETWPDGLRLFRHLRELPAPLRLPDLDAWTRSFGCSPFTVSSGAFQATPMRHRRPAAGGFFLGGKEGGFTDADEGMLVLFAQQAAPAVANARAHREDQRARADLEALVETCPVGVVVFDAATRRCRATGRRGASWRGWTCRTAPPNRCVMRWSAGAATGARSRSATSATPRRCAPRRSRYSPPAGRGADAARRHADPLPRGLVPGGSRPARGGLSVVLSRRVGVFRSCSIPVVRLPGTVRSSGADQRDSHRLRGGRMSRSMSGPAAVRRARPALLLWCSFLSLKCGRWMPFAPCAVPVGSCMKLFVVVLGLVSILVVGSFVGCLLGAVLRPVARSSLLVRTAVRFGLADAHCSR